MPPANKRLQRSGGFDILYYNIINLNIPNRHSKNGGANRENIRNLKKQESNRFL